MTVVIIACHWFCGLTELSLCGLSASGNKLCTGKAAGYVERLTSQYDPSSQELHK
jgi:hypothetical protein